MQYLNTLASAYFLIYLTQLIVAKIWLEIIKDKAIQLLAYRNEDTQKTIDQAVTGGYDLGDPVVNEMLLFLQKDVYYYTERAKFLKQHSLWFPTCQTQLAMACAIIEVDKLQKQKLCSI
jgi:hypothetical protein